MGPQDTNTVIKGTMSILELMISSGEQLLSAYMNNDKAGQMYFNDLFAGIACLKENYSQMKDNPRHAYYRQMLSNTEDTLFRIEKAVNSDNSEKAHLLIQYQLNPFLQEIQEEFKFWYTIYPDKDKMKAYYNKEFILNHANKYFREEKLPFQISIFIPAYNKVEYTRKCIESIYKYTDFNKYKCEFILVNDGSTDETEEYFNSLGIKKIIHFKENLKGAIFTTAFRICEGEYFLFVNNDTLVTEGWLDNLISCIQSDERIISVTPCTPNTSNCQSDDSGIYPKEPEKLDYFKNTSNPGLWEERSRIMPVIALYRSRLLNEIGFMDRLFYTLEYWDDDFSLRARRAGYRQILCRDTYCYHYGSVTGAAAQEENSTLEAGKKLFYLKHGVPAWSVGFCYDIFIMEIIKKHAVKKADVINILGIDCGFGDTLLRIKDCYNKCGNKVEADSMTFDERYISDLSFIASKSIFAVNAETGITQLIPDSYDLIYISQKIESYENVSDLLCLLRKLLKKNGVILFSIHNFLYKPNLVLCSEGIFPWKEERVSFLNPMLLQREISRIFSKHECIPIWGENVSDSLKGHVSAAEQLIYYCVK